jgi:hypothetical protein
MRTTLNLPEDLLRKAQKASHARTKTEAIILGLESLIRYEKLITLTSFRGKLPIHVDLRASRNRA